MKDFDGFTNYDGCFLLALLISPRAYNRNQPCAGRQGAATESLGSPHAVAPTVNDIEPDKLEFERRKQRDTLAMQRESSTEFKPCR